MAVLLLISRPGGPLSYDDHDIVGCQAAEVSPGTRVVANAADQWSFLYITDVDLDDVQYLTDDLRSSDVVPMAVGDDLSPDQLARRRYSCVLDAAASSVCGTYRTLGAAPDEQRVTWSAFLADNFRDKKED